jgi:gamma-D-glutamyl-L-lysine dipeptidyl-peptidase
MIIEVNGAQIYYETFGKDVPGQAPVLLIHGSSVTGKTDWELVAPLLARSWRVIVPDCRGHGQSTNPGHSYHFREMADDMAALVHALGYEKAHVIGHSNGGNVALVTLLEHAEVVESAVLQAANANVNPEMAEEEADYFDPQRWLRENPAGVEEMIALHGPTHGQEYWRELLRLTFQETMSEPRYTPDDLRQVQRPVLVIQGENDTANAPRRHAQFIARYIPAAELWTPEGVGHNVHVEQLFSWVERVQNFLERRGNPLSDELYRIGREQYPDRRLTPFDVRARIQAQAGDDVGAVNLVGTVLTAKQREVALECCMSAVQYLPLSCSAEELWVLMGDDAPWALINRPVDDLRRGPGILKERISQALLGEAVRVLEEQGDWSYIRMERDGYLGWIHSRALHLCTQADTVAWQASCRVKVMADLLPAWVDDGIAPGGQEQAGKLPFGVLLPVEKDAGERVQVRLPDGRGWWVARSGLLPLEEQPRPDAIGIDFTLKLVQRFVGVPYLWGGRTPFGYDCSGLAQTFWSFMGVIIPRDADQQCRAGRVVEGLPQPGDLLFFGEQNEDQPGDRFASISHVAISLGGEQMIHSNGAAWGTSYNSLNPEHANYRAWLHENLVGVRRFG